MAPKAGTFIHFVAHFVVVVVVVAVIGITGVVAAALIAGSI